MHSSLYTRPAKPMRIEVRRRAPKVRRSTPPLPAPLMVDRFTECHVTPRVVAALMVDYMGPLDRGETLEPSAGTGALLRALIGAGHDPARLVAVERHVMLSQSLEPLDAGEVHNRCFLDFAREVEGERGFARILMNPPFRKVRQHMQAAIDLMDETGAVLVALVPASYEHDRAEPLQSLPAETFSTARVHTKLVRFET